MIEKCMCVDRVESERIRLFHDFVSPFLYFEHDLITLLGSIFGFAKYLKQVCLTLSLPWAPHKPSRSRRKKAYKGLGEDANTLSDLGYHLRNLFIFEKSFKTSGCKDDRRMGEWCFMNRSISQPPLYESAYAKHCNHSMWEGIMKFTISSPL